MRPESLIVKYLANEATEEEIDQLYQWLASNSKNQRILSEYMRIYEEKYANESNFDVRHGLALLHQKIAPQPKQAKVINLKQISRIAAAIFIVAIGVAAYYVYQLDLESSTELVRKSNPAGQKSTFQLADGSIIKLNAGSSLQFPETFAEDKREVMLEGEAFFEVIRDPSRPFIVISNGVKTTVLGTSFNINSSNSQVIVAVASGKVQVEDSLGNLVALTPGEMTNYTGSGLTKLPADLEKLLAWKVNILLFKNAGLDEFKRKVVSWYGVSVDFSDVTSTNCRFTGRFKNENLTNVLEAFKISTGLEYKKENKSITITGDGCK